MRCIGSIWRWQRRTSSEARKCIAHASRHPGLYFAQRRAAVSRLSRIASRAMSHKAHESASTFRTLDAKRNRVATHCRIAKETLTRCRKNCGDMPRRD
jgi:hypothetical protein